jgi:hypothetical protein
VFNGLTDFFNETFNLDGLVEAFSSPLDGIQQDIDVVVDAVDELIDLLNEIPEVDVPSPSEVLNREEEQEQEPEQTEDPQDTGGGGGGGGGNGPRTGGGSPSFPSAGGNTGGGSDERAGGSRPDNSGSGGAGFVGLATGGLIADAGAVMLHEGERVIPAGQVSDRGGVDVDMEPVVREQRRTREAVKELASEMDVSVELRDSSRFNSL